MSANQCDIVGDDWEIVPFQSVGPLKFGMTPTEVHAILGDPSSEREFKDSRITSLHETYESCRLLLEYNLSGQLMGVQTQLPNRMTFKGAIFDTDAPDKLLDRLRLFGSPKELHGGMWWEDLGLKFSEPNFETGEVRFLGVNDTETNLFLRGHWERSEARRARPMPEPPPSLSKEWRERTAREKKFEDSE